MPALKTLAQPAHYEPRGPRTIFRAVGNERGPHACKVFFAAINYICLQRRFRPVNYMHALREVTSCARHSALPPTKSARQLHAPCHQRESRVANLHPSKAERHHHAIRGSWPVFGSPPATAWRACVTPVATSPFCLPSVPGCRREKPPCGLLLFFGAVHVPPLSKPRALPSLCGVATIAVARVSGVYRYGGPTSQPLAPIRN